MSGAGLTTLFLLIAHRATSSELNIECTLESVAETCAQNYICMNGICTALCDYTLCKNKSNTLCVMRNGKATCECLDGYVGLDGHQGCFKACNNSEEDCPRDTMCNKGKCINPCLYLPRHSHDVCNVANHQLDFRCQDGYTGNPYEGCSKACNISEEDCPRDTMCFEGKCINPCLYLPTHIHGVCNVTNHQLDFRCLDGYTGNFDEGCSKDICSSDKDCSSALACVNHKCLDPCLDKCRNIYGCSVSNHTCNCPVGYIESFTGCKKGNCTVDEECGQDKACIGYTCTDPCTDKCKGYKGCVVFQHKYYCKCKGWQYLDLLEECIGLVKHTGLRIRKFFRNKFYET